MKKGYIDKTNVILTNKKFKYFNYSGEEKEFYSEGEKLKLNAIDFFRVIEFFKKMNEGTIILNAEGNNIQLLNKSERIKVDVFLLYPVEKVSGFFSVEYLFEWLKEFKIKELKEEFIYLTFKEDYPLTLEFNEDWGILAPRIETDD